MDLNQLLEAKTLKNYQNYLESAGVPAATINRKLSSLKKWQEFVQKNYLKKISPQIDQSRSNELFFSAVRPQKVLTAAESDANPQSDQANNDSNNCQRIDHLFKESQVCQNQSDYGYTKSNQRVSVNVKNVRFFSAHIFLNQKEISKQSIAATKSDVNKISLLSLSFCREKFGTIITAPIHPAAKLTNKSEITVTKAGFVNIN